MCVAECPVPGISWMADKPEKNNVGHRMWANLFFKACNPQNSMSNAWLSVLM